MVDEFVSPVLHRRSECAGLYDPHPRGILLAAWLDHSLRGAAPIEQLGWGDSVRCLSASLSSLVSVSRTQGTEEDVVVQRKRFSSSAAEFNHLRLVSALLFGVGLVVGAIGYLTQRGVLTIGGSAGDLLVRFYIGASTELVSIAVTLLLVDAALQRRGVERRKQDLIVDLGSDDSRFALDAVRRLRAHGWLEDGTLGGADLHGANLRGANLHEANLDGADLGGADLSGADLSQASLKGVNLSEADLSGADLSRANLQGGDLTGVNLRRADLIHANLQGVDLRLADLNRAFLRGASLKEADLRFCRMREADLRDVDLTDAKLGRADLEGANLSSADLGGADLSQVVLNGANLTQTLVSRRQIFQAESLQRVVMPDQRLFEY
jgi:uncharacterized protein YjbI with pentapeptide repeats